MYVKHTHVASDESQTLLCSAQEEALSSNKAASFAQRVLDTHATAARHAAEVAAGLMPNSAAAAAHHTAQAAAAAEAEAAAAAAEAAAAAAHAPPRSAASLLDDLMGGSDEDSRVSGGENMRSRVESEWGNNRRAKAPQDQMTALSAVLAMIHAQAQELMWQLGLLQQGTALPQSKVCLGVGVRVGVNLQVCACVHACVLACVFLVWHRGPRGSTAHHLYVQMAPVACPCGKVLGGGAELGVFVGRGCELCSLFAH